MKKKILFVEDDALMLKTVSMLLSKAGYDVIEATNGREALQALEYEDYDLILTDLMLPYANGFEIIGTLKRSGKWPVPIILISAAQTEEIIKDGFDIGVDDFIRKPFTPDDLLSRINRLLPEYHHE